MTVYQATRAIHVNATDYALGATVPTVTVDLYRLDELGVVQEVPPAVLVPLVGVSAASTADVAAAIAAQHTVDNGAYVSGVLPEAYGAVGDGVANDTTALAAWAASGFARLTMQRGKTYTTTATVTTTSHIQGNGATLKATATIAGPVLDTPVGTTQRDLSVLELTIDCNNLAQTGFYPRKFGNYTARRLTVLNSTASAVIAGDPAASAVSFGAIFSNLRIDRTFGTATPASTKGLWVRNCTDGQVTEANIVGSETGVRVDSGNWRIAQAHVWGYTAPLICFDDNTNGTVYVLCDADTPSSQGFRIRGTGTVLVGGRVFVNNSIGVDNTVTGVYLDTAVNLTKVYGFRAEGVDASHRLAKDFDGVFGWDLNIEADGVVNVNVVTAAGLTGRTFNGRIRIQQQDSLAFNVRTPAGTQLLNMNSGNGSERLEIVNGANLRGYSDAYTTKKWEILGATGGATFAGPVTAPSALRPTGALAETFPRNQGSASQTAQTSGTLLMAAIDLPAGLVIGKLAFVSGNAAAVGPTNWWFGLYDSARVQLAMTADQLTAAWASFTLKSLAVATIASGASASFTTTYSGLHYIGIMVAAGTVPPLQGATVNTGLGGIVPILYGTSSTGLTTPPAFPTTAAAITATAIEAYAYVGT